MQGLLTLLCFVYQHYFIHQIVQNSKALFTRLTNLIWFSDLIFSTVCPYCQFASNEIWSVLTGKQISGLSTSVSLVVIYASTRCLDTFSYKTVSLEILLLFMSIMIILWCWTPRHMREHKHQRYCTHIGVVQGSSIGGPRAERKMFGPR